MLFNSPEFIFVFLPAVFCVYQLLRATRRESVPVVWLVLASLVFYGYWNVGYIALVGASIGVNFVLSGVLARAPEGRRSRGRAILAAGLVFNLGLLAYFKYTNFFIDNVAALTGTSYDFERVILPIGISFFTFQQVAYLVDVYRREAFERTFAKYSLFVCFFPQLIAGPIVHHREMMPQFGKQKRSDIAGDVGIGLTIFAIGLFKKVVIADTVAIESSLIFDSAAAGVAPTLIDAWAGTFFYTFQIYFDFSGYSDMAIGLARMFGIRLPINFASPYKATSIIDFWRRWHITLSRFLRDYLYIPLGGNKCSVPRRYTNVFLTMLLGGIWHGAGWTFFLWGGMHGAYIVINQFWREFAARRRPERRPASPARILLCRTATLLLVMVAWVPFRADGIAATWSVYAGMIGLNGISLPDAAAPLLSALPAVFDAAGIDAAGIRVNSPLAVVGIPFLLLVVWFAPNTQEIMRNAAPALESDGYPATRLDTAPRRRWTWTGSRGWAVVTAAMLVVCFVKFNDVSEFIYFQF